METSNGNEPFKSSLGDWHNWLKPPFINTAFEHATNALSWTQVEKAIVWVKEGKGQWEQVLPIPDIDPSETEYWTLTLRGEELRQAIEVVTQKRKQKWKSDTEQWFLQSGKIIKRRKKQLKHLFDNGLKERKAEGLITTLTKKNAFNEWRKQNANLTVSELKQFFVSAKIAKPILDEIIKNWKVEYGSIEKEGLITYSSFLELFKRQGDIDICVNTLKSYSDGQNKRGEFKKYTVVAWIDHLYSIGKIHSNKYESLVVALSHEFNDFSISRRTFYENPTTASENAKKFFLMNIPH